MTAAAALPSPTPTGRQRFSAARSVIEQAIHGHAFPGAAWGILHNGEIVAIDSAGRFTYDAASPEVAPSTVYDLASLTKVIATTASAMVLYDRRILSLDTFVGDVLPGFVIGERHDRAASPHDPASGWKHRVTLRMLLDHSSGLPGYVRLFDEYRSAHAMLQATLTLPLDAEPGSQAEYSDLGFILLGKAIEVLSGDILPRFFQREIAAPLNLRTARYSPPAAWRNQIPPTESDTAFRRRIIQGEAQDENCFALGGVSGHAGLFGNVHDALTFAGSILAEGKTAEGRQLFRPETVRLFATRQTRPAGTTRALGWDTPSTPSSSGKFFSPESIGHLGYAGTSLWIDPARNLAVVLLTNRTWPDRSNNAIKEVRPAFHDAIAEGLK